MYIPLAVPKLLLATASVFVPVAARHSMFERELPTCKNRCPPFNGSFTIDQYKLYPENADFDFNTCLLYIGCLWNATVAVYDPYKEKIVNILEFPGISHNNDFHIGGVGVDQRTGLVSIVVDAAAAFITGGADISGTNWIMQWDPKKREVLYKLNLTETAHGLYGGYQDMEQDPQGNVFVVGSYPSSILRVDKNGKTVTPWYMSTPAISTNNGLSGLAAKGWLLLGNDNPTGQIYKFDMRAKKGVPVLVPHYPNTTITLSDAIYFPPRYGGTVLLVSENFAGVSVLRSKDGRWDWAEYLGVVPNMVPDSFATAVIQVGDGLYIVASNVGDPVTPGTTGGNRTMFPFIDITTEVDKLLCA